MLSGLFRSLKAVPLLRLRIGLFFLGAVLGLAGIFLDLNWLVTAALIVLLSGVALRMAPARDPGSGEEEPKAPTQ